MKATDDEPKMEDDDDDSSVETASSDGSCCRLREMSIARIVGFRVGNSGEVRSKHGTDEDIQPPTESASDERQQQQQHQENQQPVQQPNRGEQPMDEGEGIVPGDNYISKYIILTISYLYHHTANQEDDNDDKEDDVLVQKAALERLQESKNELASVQLCKKQKLEQKVALERKLCELTSQNSEMRVELQRAARQLSLRHRELLDAQSRSEDSRNATKRFDAKLKRVIGVARLLGSYQNKVESALIELNETETRLNFTKGQGKSQLQSATSRRDDAKHRHDLLVNAIQSNASKERVIAEEIAKVRTDIGLNEQDLTAAQQMESQTKLRVETIEHELSMERTRHATAVADLESKSKEMVFSAEYVPSY